MSTSLPEWTPLLGDQSTVNLDKNPLKALKDSLIPSHTKKIWSISIKSKISKYTILHRPIVASGRSTGSPLSMLPIGKRGQIVYEDIWMDSGTQFLNVTDLTDMSVPKKAKWQKWIKGGILDVGKRFLLKAHVCVFFCVKNLTFCNCAGRHMDGGRTQPKEYPPPHPDPTMSNIQYVPIFTTALALHCHR